MFYHNSWFHLILKNTQTHLTVKKKVSSTIIRKICIIIIIIIIIFFLPMNREGASGKIDIFKKRTAHYKRNVYVRYV